MAKSSSARKSHYATKSMHRQRELEWIEAHADQLPRLVGEWIVLEGED